MKIKLLLASIFMMALTALPASADWGYRGFDDNGYRGRGYDNYGRRGYDDGYYRRGKPYVVNSPKFNNDVHFDDRGKFHPGFFSHYGRWGQDAFASSSTSSSASASSSGNGSASANASASSQSSSFFGFHPGFFGHW